MRASRWVMSLRMSAPRGGIGGGGGPGVLCWRPRVVERVAEEHPLVAHAAGRPQRRVIPPFLVRLDQLMHGRTQVLARLGGEVEVHRGGERRLLPGGGVADDPHQPLPGPGQPAVDPDRRDGVRGEPGLGVLPRRGGREAAGPQAPRASASPRYLTRHGRSRPRPPPASSTNPYLARVRRWKAQLAGDSPSSSLASVAVSVLVSALPLASSRAIRSGWASARITFGSRTSMCGRSARAGVGGSSEDMFRNNTLETLVLTSDLGRRRGSWDDEACRSAT